MCSVLVASDGCAGAEGDGQGANFGFPSRTLVQAGFALAMWQPGGDAMNQTHHGKPDPFPKRVSTSSLDSSLSHSCLHGAASVTWGAFGHLSSSAAPWDRAVPRGHRATSAAQVGSHSQEA